MPPFSRRGSGGTTVTVTLGGGGGGGGGLISKKKATAGGVRGGPTRARACAGPRAPTRLCVRLPRAARRGACDGARVLTADGALALPVPRVRRPGSCRPR